MFITIDTKATMLLCIFVYLQLMSGEVTRITFKDYFKMEILPVSEALYINMFLLNYFLSYYSVLIIIYETINKEY